ncbi:regulator of chromosome condensation 1/beta-lactamase-inhibitor protein II, partial [Thamnocephalis sphaerospora]
MELVKQLDALRAAERKSSVYTAASACTQKSHVEQYSDDDDGDGDIDRVSDNGAISETGGLVASATAADLSLLSSFAANTSGDTSSSKSRGDGTAGKRGKRARHPWASVDRAGRAALHYAASWGCARLVRAAHRVANDAAGLSGIRRKNISASQQEQMILAANALLHNANLRDTESGWTPLHRAFYAGRIRVALELMRSAHVDISVKDHDGRLALDLVREALPLTTPYGWEATQTLLYTWGRNANYLLGHADQDDRARPDRVPLPSSTKRIGDRQASLYSVHSQRDPALRIRNVAMSKLHTVVVTECASAKQQDEHTVDQEAVNLLTCGFGHGGRLGNSEATRFALEPVRGIPDAVTTAACGRDHTVAVTVRGEVYTFGDGRWGQLGYSVARENTGQRSAHADERERGLEAHVQLIPRRVQGALRTAHIIGCASSSWHTVVHTREALFTFGRDVGQLGYRADGERQMVPRCAPLTLPPGCTIAQVSATERATACLLSNGDAFVLAHYHQQRISIPFGRLPSEMHAHVPASALPLCVVRLASDGESYLGVLSSWGDVYIWPTTAGQEHGRGNAEITAKQTRHPRRVW